MISRALVANYIQGLNSFLHLAFDGLHLLVHGVHQEGSVQKSVSNFSAAAA